MRRLEEIFNDFWDAIHIVGFVLLILASIFFFSFGKPIDFKLDYDHIQEEYDKQCQLDSERRAQEEYEEEMKRKEEEEKREEEERLSEAFRRYEEKMEEIRERQEERERMFENNK